ncbi:MAG: hypothetical protein ACJ72E_06440 [Marmoricola sp.]
MTAEPMSRREIRQTLAAIAAFLPTEHAAYIRAMPQDDLGTVVEAYLAARSTESRLPQGLVDRMHRQLAWPA